jgi:tripartite-type tricarboxylate transporter receptor subunit TctC
MGMVAPAAAPQAVIDKLAAAAQRAVRSPALAEGLRRDGVEPVGGTPQAFAAQVAKEIMEWRSLAQAAKISLE